MSLEVVYATGTERVALVDGRVANVVKGGHWPATDPVVRARPSLFTADPRYGLLYSEAPPGYDHELHELPEPSDVEEATSNPGERRSVRRRGES